jgi:hypothetical protein
VSPPILLPSFNRMSTGVGVSLTKGEVALMGRLLGFGKGLFPDTHSTSSAWTATLALESV